MIFGTHLVLDNSDHVLDGGPNPPTEGGLRGVLQNVPRHVPVGHLSTSWALVTRYTKFLWPLRNLVTLTTDCLTTHLCTKVERCRVFHSWVDCLSLFTVPFNFVSDGNLLGNISIKFQNHVPNATSDMAYFVHKHRGPKWPCINLTLHLEIGRLLTGLCCVPISSYFATFRSKLHTHMGQKECNAEGTHNNNKKYILSNSESVQCKLQLHFWSRDVHPVQNLLLCTKFHQNRTIFHWDMAI